MCGSVPSSSSDPSSSRPAGWSNSSSAAPWHRRPLQPARNEWLQATQAPAPLGCLLHRRPHPWYRWGSAQCSLGRLEGWWQIDERWCRDRLWGLVQVWQKKRSGWMLRGMKEAHYRRVPRWWRWSGLWFVHGAQWQSEERSTWRTARLSLWKASWADRFPAMAWRRLLWRQAVMPELRSEARRQVGADEWTGACLRAAALRRWHGCSGAVTPARLMWNVFQIPAGQDPHLGQVQSIHVSHNKPAEWN